MWLYISAFFPYPVLSLSLSLSLFNYREELPSHGGHLDNEHTHTHTKKRCIVIARHIRTEINISQINKNLF